MSSANKFIISVFGIIMFSSLCAQIYQYNILSKGDTLGVLSVTKQLQDDKTHYSYNIDMSVNLVINIHIKYDLSATYDDEKLLYSNVDNIVNGKKHHTANVVWKNSYYLINTGEKKMRKLTEKVTYSNVRLFFEQPIGVGKVFSEMHGEYGRLVLIKQNHYELNLISGKKNQYKYSHGKLVAANIDGSVIPFQLMLKKE